MSPYVRRSSVRHADRVLARSVLLILLAVFTLTIGGGPATPEDEARHSSAAAVLGLAPGAPDHAAAWASAPVDVVVTIPFLALGELLALLESERRPDGVHSGSEGCPDLLPRILATWRGPFAGAWIGWLVVLVARRIGARRRPAWLVGLFFGLATFAWPAARTAEPEILGALFLFISFHFLLRIRESYERLKDPGRWLFLGCGVALGATTGTHVVFLPATLWMSSLAIGTTLRGHRRLGTTRWAPDRRTGGFALDLLLLILPILAMGGWCALVGLDAIEFGSLDPAELLPGLMAVFVSPDHGLLMLAPSLLLLPIGISMARKQGERLWVWSTLGVVISVAIPAALSVPAGTRGYGPLTLLPALPFLFVGLALVPRRDRSPWLLWAFAITAFLGVLQQLPAAMLDLGVEQELEQRARVVVAAEQGPEAAPPAGTAAAWDLRFSTPGTLWRLLRRQIAVGDGVFPVEELFLMEGGEEVRLAPGRDAWHLGLLQLTRRWGQTPWIVLLAAAILGIIGVVLAVQGLDPAAP